jgi:hypothetical protein
MAKRKTNDREWRTDKALKKRACMIAYRPHKRSRGWWVREFHSTIAMQKYLKGEWHDRPTFGETSGFRTEMEARDYALGYPRV